VGQPRYANTRKVSTTFTVDTSAYQAGDVVQVGAAGIRVKRVCKYRRQKLLDVLVREVGTQKAALTLLFFRSAPTVAAANAAYVLSAADLLNLVGKVNVLTTDYETVGGQSVAHVGNIWKVLEGWTGDTDPGTGKLDDTTVGDLWMVLVTTGTPTYGAASALSVELGFEAD
jgi:hypothetical protein